MKYIKNSKKKHFYIQQFWHNVQQLDDRRQNDPRFCLKLFFTAFKLNMLSKLYIKAKLSMSKDMENINKIKIYKDYSIIMSLILQ